MQGSKILVTGGASGIGLGLTKRFIRENNTVIVVGRRESALQELAAELPSVITRVCDVSKEEERVGLFDWIAKEHPDLNVLVNNAGVQNWMNISDNDFFAKANDEIEINISAPVHLCKLFTGLKSPHAIMNVTSGLAFIPLSKVPVYCATKAFLRSFTLSLRHMLKGQGIEVIEIIPPALNTDLGGKGIHTEFPPVSEFVDSIFAQLKAGKNELTFGMSESRAKANNEVIAELFNRMNP